MFHDDEPEISERTRTWYEHAWKSLQKRWVQVAIIVAIWILVVLASGLMLAPDAKPDRRRKSVTQSPDEYRFVQCPKCGYETRYTPQLVGEDCSKCREDPVGRLEPSSTSLRENKEDDGPSPYRWVYLAVSLESLVAIGVIVYLLYLPVPDPASVFYVFNCPHCNQRLRFRQTALGGLGQCSRCKRPIRFPDEDGAVLEYELEREQARLLVEGHDDDDEE